ncbi:MAG: hypothetical protein GWP17_02900 [Aquificales bacterium]|nr:hypothetical protein [Aquificales bacterium]
MSEIDFDQELQDSRAMISGLAQEVRDERSVLAGGTTRKVTNDIFDDLNQSKITFGFPQDRLIQLTPDLLKSLKIQLDPIQTIQMNTQSDFYYMSLAVSLFPKRSNLFKLVECRLEFRGIDGKAAIVQSIFPQSQWKTVLEWGGNLSLGLNSNLDWDIGVDGDKLAEVTSLAGVPSANLTTKNELGSRILVPDYTFNVGRAEITATGKGNDHCQWRLRQPELKQSQTVDFIVIFKVPKGTQAIELEGKVIGEPDMDMLVAEVDDVFGELGDKFKNMFRKSDDDRQGAEKFPIGSHEVWSPLNLPVQ